MKKMVYGIVMCLLLNTSSLAENLLDVYAQAVVHDTLYRERILNEKISYQDIRLQWANLLPTVNATLNPSVTRQTSGSSLDFFVDEPPAGSEQLVVNAPATSRQYILALNASQTVFDFSKFFGVQQANALSKQKKAELNAATQDLMLRVANAYFAVLQAQDNVHFSQAKLKAFEEQLNQIKKQFEVGVKTNTEVYTAEARYSSTVASLVSAKNDLDARKEDLRVIIQFYPEQLDELDEHFPLLTPAPAQIEVWVDTALRQNWSIHAERYAVDAALQNVRQQQSGHLPTLSAAASISKTQTHTAYPTMPADSGSYRTVDRSLSLQLTMPLLAGGAVVAGTEKATLQLSVAKEELNRQMRTTVNEARTSYLSVMSGIREVEANQRTVKASTSSLGGMRDSYNAGVATLVDVLNEQQNLFEAQMNYSKNRYQYVINLLTLKKAAGTLSLDDLRLVNQWLVKHKRHVHTQKRSHYKKRVIAS